VRLRLTSNNKPYRRSRWARHHAEHQTSDASMLRAAANGIRRRTPRADWACCSRRRKALGMKKAKERKWRRKASANGGHGLKYLSQNKRAGRWYLRSVYGCYARIPGFGPRCYALAAGRAARGGLPVRCLPRRAYAPRGCTAVRCCYVRRVGKACHLVIGCSSDGADAGRA